MQSIPHPNDAPEMKFDNDRPAGLKRYSMFESVDAQTDARTDELRLESHTISSPRAFGSGELIIQASYFCCNTYISLKTYAKIHLNREVCIVIPIESRHETYSWCAILNNSIAQDKQHF